MPALRGWLEEKKEVFGENKNLLTSGILLYREVIYARETFFFYTKQFKCIEGKELSVNDQI